MTRSAELRELPNDELWERLDAAKEELFNLRFQFATGQLDNPMRIKQVRHDIARLLTVLRHRELGGVEIEEPVRPRRRKKAASEEAEEVAPEGEAAAGAESDDEDAGEERRGLLRGRRRKKQADEAEEETS